MKIKLPEMSLVILIGTSGSGKSTFAKKNFDRFEILSSDECRGIVSNDENSQEATGDAFDLLHYTLRKRLKAGLLTVIDATNVQSESRKNLIEIGKEYNVLPVAVVFDIPEKLCVERNEKRADRNFGARVVRTQAKQLKRSFRSLKNEGFRQIEVFKSVEDVESFEGIERIPLYNNKKDVTGPFDIIGDIHGCYDELVLLLEKLGYSVKYGNEFKYSISVEHPEGRQAVFLGDLVDRGPKIPEVLKLVMSMVDSKTGWCVPGNHDLKLLKKIKGKSVKMSHGLQESVDQLENGTPEFIEELKEFLYGLISHYVFDGGNLVVAHAGLKEEMQGRASGRVRNFCLYGETTGETDEYGLPERLNWAAEYKGRAKVVYGHTPVTRTEWLNRTINVDTGCVFGGSLTALKYPEEELVSVPSIKEYYEPVGKFAETEDTLTLQQQNDDILDYEDISGKKILLTQLRNNITIREENAIAALEVMSRYAVNPKWLIYLPPTMSPSEVSEEADYLEHPEQAIEYYRSRGVGRIVCEEKHMGSRVVLMICKDEDVARDVFGVEGEGSGKVVTRTGRNFFTNKALEDEFINKVIKGLAKSGFWNKFDTNWVCLDAELMPWSAKALMLLKDQYASVGAAATVSLEKSVEELKKCENRGIEGFENILANFTSRQDSIIKYIDAYRQYCWDVNTVDDYKLAPFHILATEGKVHFGKDHEWHMTNIAEFCSTDESLFVATPYRVVDTESEESIQGTINWWMQLTGNGGEGMVVKPYDYIAKGKKGLVQPAVKCRGREYLRIIYGPEYLLPENLERLKKRSLNRKRSLAIREFALGHESLLRFVNKEPLRKIHECVFAVLALESEEVDPRL